MLRDPAERALFKEAFAEPNRLKDVYLPSNAPSYRSSEEEIIFMRNLFEENPQKLCRYMAYKIFNFIRLFHEISLLVFIMDFMENDAGDWVAIDAKIFKIFTHRKELTRMPSKDDVIIPAERILERIQMLQEEINQKIEKENNVAQVTFLTQKAIEDEDFIKKVHLAEKDKPEDIVWLTEKPYKPLPPGFMQNAKFKEYIEFKQKLQAEFGGKSGYTSKTQRRYNLNKKLEQNNMVFTQLNPNMKKKLSDIVVEEGYEFDKMYNKYVVQATVPLKKTLISDKSTESPKQTFSIFKSDDERLTSRTNKDMYTLKLDALLRQQSTEMSCNAERSSRSKNSSVLSFLNRKAKSMIQDQILTAEDSVTQTMGSQLPTDRIPVKEKGYLPILGVAHRRSASTRAEPLTKEAVVSALQEQIEIARNRHKSTRQRRDHIIMSMQLSHDHSAVEQKKKTVGTKLSVNKQMLEDKLETMQECQLNSNFWSWQPNMPELSCVTNAVPPSKQSTDRQMQKTISEQSKGPLGLKLLTTNTRLKRTDMSEVSKKQGYLLRFDM